MNNEVKARWVAALRSGDYVQGHDRLTSSTGRGFAHCCLGVLCELAVADGVVTRNVEHGTVTYGGEEMYLPSVVRSWAALGRNPVVRLDNVDVGLATLNDGTDGYDVADFAQIAQLIEEHL